MKGKPMDDRDLLISGGQVIDPANGINSKKDILLRRGRVDVVGEKLPPGTTRVIDATGCLVIPGLVDTHVHLCEPYGGAQGYRMLARAGVTCALDMAGEPELIMSGIKSGGS